MTRASKFPIWGGGSPRAPTSPQGGSYYSYYFRRFPPAFRPLPPRKRRQLLDPTEARPFLERPKSTGPGSRGRGLGRGEALFLRRAARPAETNPGRRIDIEDGVEGRQGSPLQIDRTGLPGEGSGRETGDGVQCKRGSARAPDPGGSCKAPLWLIRACPQWPGFTCSFSASCVAVFFVSR